MSDLNLENPQRQSLVGVAVIFVKNLRQAVNVFISIIAVQFGFEGSFLGLSLVDYAYILTAVFLVISYLQYQRFFFYRVDDKFVIEKGLLSRDRITIPFDRIQTVNLNQNVIQRIFNVIALKVDTAGSSAKELEIPALPIAYARKLQEFLVHKKQEYQEEIKESEEEKSEASQISSIKNDKSPLIKLSPADLLKIGLTENHLRTALIAFAVVNGYVWQYEEYLLKPYEDYLAQQANSLLASWAILLPVILVLFAVVAILISMIRTFLRYYGLEFYSDAKGVQMVSGLLKRMEYQLPIHKIQYLKWKSNPLRKLLGLFTLVIKQASSEDIGDRKSLTVPGVSKKHLYTVIDEFFDSHSEGVYSFRKPHYLLFLQSLMRFAIIPSLALLALGFIGWRWMFFSPAFAAVSAFLQYKYYRSVIILFNRDVLSVKKGWLFPATFILNFYKIQNVKVQQSVFQRRRGVASLSIHSAAGDEVIPHLKEEEVLALHNYILYKIESDHRSWM